VAISRYTPIAFYTTSLTSMLADMHKSGDEAASLVLYVEHIMKKLVTTCYMITKQLAKRIKNAVKVRLPDFSSASLTYLRLQSNSLIGTIPSSLLSDADINAFIELDHHSNKISGGLPSDLSRFN
jgi:hypothetical protein